MAALADQRHGLLEVGELAECGRDEDAARAVELGLLGVADDEALPPARLLVEAGEGGELGADRREGGLGVKQQAAIGVRRQNNAPGARSERFPMPRGDREPALRVEADFGRALKHLSPPRWLKTALPAFFSHEITLFATVE
jgi:hypothetical protein